MGTWVSDPSHLLTCENNGITICADPQRKDVEHMIVPEAGDARWWTKEVDKGKSCGAGSDRVAVVSTINHPTWTRPRRHSCSCSALWKANLIDHQHSSTWPALLSTLNCSLALQRCNPAQLSSCTPATKNKKFASADASRPPTLSSPLSKASKLTDIYTFPLSPRAPSIRTARRLP